MTRLPPIIQLLAVAAVSAACGGETASARDDGGGADDGVSDDAPAEAIGDEGGEAEGGSRLGVPGPGRYYHGVHPGGTSGEEDDLTAALVDEYETTVGRTAAWVYFSHNWYHGRAFPLATATWIRDRGAVPYVRLMLRSDAEGNRADPVYTLAAIAAGDFDADIEAWGDAARGFESPLLAEFGTEVNGRWFPWNGVWNGGPTDGPAAFRDAFRHIVEAVRGRGADNLTWVFHVNDGDDPPEEWNRFENYYPGDDVVDWVGVSIYGAQTPMDTEWPLFRDGADQAIPRLAALAPGKPLIVLEFGVTSGNPLGDPAAWADAALADILSARWPQVRGFSWWNETWPNDGDPSHDTDMRVQSVPGLADVFRARLAGPSIVDRPMAP